MIALSHAQINESESKEAQLRFEGRLNELMLWRLSDELALKPQDEQSLKAILKRYQEQRKSALTQQEAVLGKMTTAEKAAPAKLCDTCLGELRKNY